MEIDYQKIFLGRTNDCQKLTLAIGNFSGLHLGHQSLINQVVFTSAQTNTIPAILTFNHHKKSQLLSNDTFINKINSLGIKVLIVIDFSEQFQQITAQDFISFLRYELNVDNVIIGEDFHFGHNRSGNVLDLKKSPLKTYAMPLMKINNQKISSSAIINCIQNGDIITANTMLGYNYAIEGKVKKGLQNGRKLGFPTINIDLNKYIKPKNGVYVSKVNYCNNSYWSMTYIGMHKSIDGLTHPILESNIFDFNENIYGHFVSVELIEKIADDFKFSSLEDLKTALNTYKKNIQSKYR